jgi:putative endopeptidase
VKNRRAYLAGGALLAFILLATGCASTTAREADVKKAAIGKWGFDLEGMDSTVKPGDDFYRYAGGAWIKKAQIPADRATWGSMTVLGAKAEEDVKTLAAGLSEKPNAAGSNEQKIADFYSSYLDTKTINELGMKPFEADLARIAAVKSHEEVASLMSSPGFPGNSPIYVVPSMDSKNPDRYILLVGQAGIGLPIRDYYLNKDPQFAAIREKYRVYIAKMLGMAKLGGSATAQSVINLETKIAERQWPLEKQRNMDLTYNPKTQKQLLASFPQFPWSVALKTAGLDKQDSFVVAEIGAVAELAKLFRATPVETWRAYMYFHYLNASADIMPSAYDDANFAFFGTVINGLQTPSERWKRAVGALNGPRGGATLAEAVGSIYVQRYFSPESKAQVTELVNNLLAAYQSRIQNSDWMSPETRKVAIRKAQTVRVKVGYPDKWRDYSKLDIQPRDAYGNRVRCSVFDWNRLVSRINEKTDRDEWGMAPQTVNAYYNATFNEIVFPAAILQPPYFDPNADPAIIYGGVGAVIGHEMGHGYDDQGAKSDEHGVLRSWWKKEDEDRFRVKTKALAAQFSTYSPVPGLHVNGDYTSGENIGDLGGTAVAFEAYHISLKGKPAPVLDGFTGDQRFYLGWAQVWRSVAREEYLRRATTSDFHSPDEFRVNGIVRNLDGWYEAFHVKDNDKLYLKPEERVRIW